MYLTKYDAEKERRLIEFFAQREVRKRVAADMLMDGEPLTKIIRYSRLAEDAILNIAKRLGISIQHG